MYLFNKLYVFAENINVKIKSIIYKYILLLSMNEFFNLGVLLLMYNRN